MENEETKKISIDDTLELLKCSWQLTENNFEKESPKYYSKWDQKVLSNKDGVQLKMSYFFLRIYAHILGREILKVLK